MRLRETALPETFSAFRRGGTLGRPYFLVLYTFLQLYRGDPCGRPWEYELRSKRAPSSVWPTASHLPPCRGKAILHRERWLRKPRRSAKTAPGTNFAHPGPSGPEENAGKHSWFCAPEMKLLQNRRASPVMGSGERRLWARSAHRSRPRRRFGYFAAAGKVTRRPQTAEPPAKTYGASMILGPQIFFHPRHPM